MPWAAEQASRFVYHACRGPELKPAGVEDAFYAGVLECALGFLGSKILCPSRKLFPESTIFDSVSIPGDSVRMFGHALGSDLYTGYVKGQLSRRWLRSLFFSEISQPGAARLVYDRTCTKLASLHRESLRMVS